MPPPHISKPFLVFFRRIVRGYFRRHFRAVRLSRTSHLLNLADPRLILYANHSSWWDPMISVLLGATLMPRRSHFAPMDADALARYGILQRIGVFPVEMNSPRGAAQFIRTGRAIVESGGALWITPQGRFADTRERPLDLKPGLAALATKIHNGCTLQPIAIEYLFWDERLPETLLHFGAPIHVDAQSTEAISVQLQTSLLDAMETLKAAALARDPEAFTVLQQGRAGTGGFYEAGRRTLARLRGRPYQPDHTPHPQPRTEPRAQRDRA